MTSKAFVQHFGQLVAIVRVTMLLAGPSERNSYWREGLKQGASEARKDGGPGACPGKIFHDHAL